MKFIPSNRSNPCPICTDIKGRCRSKQTDFTLPDGSTNSDRQFLCMRVHQDNNGYKFTGDTSDGLWGKFISFDLSESLSLAWGKGRNCQSSYSAKPKITKRSPRIKSKNKPSLQHLLSIPQRHHAIERVLSQLPLTIAHRKSLIKRGFTDQQIKQYSFKSVRYQQPLVEPVSDRLAGVAPEGRYLTNKFSGLIVPIRNEEGLYIGWQYRLDKTSNHRYLWAKSNGSSSHLSEYSELPLSFSFPSHGITNRKYIALTESVGFKPQLTANHFGLICLGASGGLFAVSPKLLKVYLNKASVMLHSKQILLFPDAGAVRNPLVLKQYKRTVDLVKSFGYTVEVAWWGQVNKSCPDPDEFKGDYRIISIDKFFDYGLRYCAYFPGKDNRNVVRQLSEVLTNTSNPAQLKKAIAAFQFRYSQQFDTIKRICWRHLDHQTKQFICSVYS